ncbi:MAG: hypothetical protein VX436_00785 [Planctomycetota bacterium]|nr:hypothetical protein [Planctomycetota bacterium]
MKSNMLNRMIILTALFSMAISLDAFASNVSRHCHVICIQEITIASAQPVKGSKPKSNIKLDRDGKSKIRPDRDKPMPSQMLENVMAVATEIDPDLATQLSEICAADPDAFENIIRRQGRRFGSLVRLQEKDPQLFEVKLAELKTDAEIYFVTEALKGNDLNDPAIQAQLAQLRGLIRVKTKLSAKAQTLYIQRLERHLDGLRARLEHTTSQFDDIVEDQVESLLEEIFVAPSDELCCQHPHHLECIVNTTSAAPGDCDDPHHLECGALLNELNRR